MATCHYGLSSTDKVETERKNKKEKTPPTPSPQTQPKATTKPRNIIKAGLLTHTEVVQSPKGGGSHRVYQQPFQREMPLQGTGPAAGAGEPINTAALHSLSPPGTGAPAGRQTPALRRGRARHRRCTQVLQPNSELASRTGAARPPRPAGKRRRRGHLP